jgi:hypothetical protein
MSSPTVFECAESNFRTGFFLFSEEVLQDFKEMQASSNPLIKSKDDSLVSGVSLSCGDFFHKRVPTTPNFQILNSRINNLPLPRRPIKENAPELVSRIIPISKQFSCIPKPADFEIPGVEGFEVYSKLVNDLEITINPKELGFIPSSFWPEGSFLLRDVISDYFMKECGPDSRFSHKLFNALQKVLRDPFYSCFFGVEWLNENVLSVNGPLFGTILGINHYEEELFGSYGQLSIHGFVQQSETEALGCVDVSQIEGIDFVSVRIFIHNNGVFTQSATEHDIITARWSRRRYSKSGSHPKF